MKSTKSHKLFDPMPSISASKETPKEIDWNICVLCQQISPEILQCPAQSKRPSAGQGYSTLARNIISFSEIGELPIPIDVGNLDEGSGIEKTLAGHQAKWHKSCYMKFN